MKEMHKLDNQGISVGEKDTKQEEKKETGNSLAIPGHIQRFYNTDIKFIARSKIYEI